MVLQELFMQGVLAEVFVVMDVSFCGTLGHLICTPSDCDCQQQAVY